MDKVKVIEELKKIKSERGMLSKVEKENRMPLNSLSAYVNGKKEMPPKWVKQLGEYLTALRKIEALPNGVSEMKAIVGYAVDVEVANMEEWEEFKKAHPPQWIRLSILNKEGYKTYPNAKVIIDNIFKEFSSEFQEMILANLKANHIGEAPGSDVSDLINKPITTPPPTKEESIDKGDAKSDLKRISTFPKKEIKPKKEMPSGLSKSEQLRWMRENK